MGREGAGRGGKTALTAGTNGRPMFSVTLTRFQSPRDSHEVPLEENDAKVADQRQGYFRRVRDTAVCLNLPRSILAQGRTGGLGLMSVAASYRALDVHKVQARGFFTTESNTCMRPQAAQRHVKLQRSLVSFVRRFACMM